MKAYALFALSLAALYPSPAGAAADGAFLNDMCGLNRSFVLAYVMGVSEAAERQELELSHAEFSTKSPDGKEALAEAQKETKPYCLPKDVTNPQLVEALCLYVRVHADERRASGPLLFKKAARASWPCPK